MFTFFRNLGGSPPKCSSRSAIPEVAGSGGWLFKTKRFHSTAEIPVLLFKVRSLKGDWF